MERNYDRTRDGHVGEETFKNRLAGTIFRNILVKSSTVYTLAVRMVVAYRIDKDNAYPYLDPTTFAPAIRHPLIEFDPNSLKIVLKENVKEWLQSTFKDTWHFTHTKEDYYIVFKTHADMSWFKLRWS